MLTLAIEKREKTGKLDGVRASGKLPAVYYGPKEASTNAAVSTVEFKKVWKRPVNPQLLFSKTHLVQNMRLLFMRLTFILCLANLVT